MNNRIYKFRAWDGLKMEEVNLFDFGLAKYTKELMQFTGLTDKFGREIYEGDIVKDFLEGRENSIFPVEWHDGGFNLNEGSFAEVIGNIYEHPELIK